MILNNPKALASYIADQRKQQKLSQATVSDRVGLKQSTISEFENNPDGTKLDTLFRILSALNLDLQVEPKKLDILNNDEW